jgi:hypothetical protein
MKFAFLKKKRKVKNDTTTKRTDLRRKYLSLTTELQLNLGFSGRIGYHSERPVLHIGLHNRIVESSPDQAL